MNIDMLTDTGQLIGEQRELAETIGLDAYKKLIKNYGGNPVYIPKTETVLKEVRDNGIRQKFNGKNYRSLAKEYRISEKTIKKNIIGKVLRKVPRSVPLNVLKIYGIVVVTIIPYFFWW